MQQLFRLLRQLCLRIQLEKLDHQVKIVMHSNRTKQKTNEFKSHVLVDKHTPDPIDDIV